MWNFKSFVNHIAIIDDNNVQVTYEQMRVIEEQIGNLVESRSLVVCLCQNTIGSIVGYASFINKRIVPLLVNAYMSKELLSNIFELYEPSYIWLPQEMMVERLFNNLQVVYSVYNYSLVKTNYEVSNSLYADLGLLLSTSGSTGSPKFVRQSYDNIKSNAESIVHYLKLDDTEKPITTLPMNYTYGLSIINSHFMVGAQLLVTNKSLMQKEFWDFFKEKGATSFGGVPYTYEMLEKLCFRKMELPSLRTITQAGGKITQELHKKFAQYADDKGKKFIVMYGQCEATARMGYLPPEMAIKKCGAMGIAIPGGKFTLIDEKGRIIREPYVTGELVYEGKNVTLGYAECRADLQKADERNGILRTGDMAQVDEDGYYSIVGRKKRFLKIFGNRVNLDEVDRLIKGTFSGIDCASTGEDDHMLIMITDKSRVGEIKNYVVKTTKLNPNAFKVIAIEKIPKNDAGKVLYKELEKYYLTL